MSDEEHRRRRDDHWHFGKTLDVGHILTTIGLVAVVVLYVTDLDKRIAVLESGQKIQLEIKADIKEIQRTLAPLPGFIEQKNRTDASQWEQIRELQKED